MRAQGQANIGVGFPWQAEHDKLRLLSASQRCFRQSIQNTHQFAHAQHFPYVSWVWPNPCHLCHH